MNEFKELKCIETGDREESELVCVENLIESSTSCRTDEKMGMTQNGMQ